tara:strand:+ start:467 stop:946 length:480 start_codon:yes stop_codon:yes gene_type:complete
MATKPEGINHLPIFEITEVYKKFREEYPSLLYVCTTELEEDDYPVDIYWTKNPQKPYGNHYFGLFVDFKEKKPKICNADSITEKEFGFIKDKYGGWHYSRSVSHHNYVNEDDNIFISGGRKEVKIGGDPIPQFHIFKVEDGSFVEVEHRGEVKYEKSNK